MPSHPRVESLTERDGAWREAQNVPADSQVPLSSSPPSVASGQDRHTDGAPSGALIGSEAAALRTSREFGVSAAPVLSLTVRSDAPAPSPNYLVLENAQNPPLSRTATEPSASTVPFVQAPPAEPVTSPTARVTKNPAPIPITAQRVAR